MQKQNININSIINRRFDGGIMPCQIDGFFVGELERGQDNDRDK
jgi:hypothetical protein